MRLSDSVKNTYPTSVRRRRSKDAVNKWYSDSQKLEAVKCWLVTGNLAQTAAALSIPLPTLKTWRYSDWWKELVDEIKSENSIQLSNKLKTIANKALDVTADRLENGDYIYDQKTGELKRKPVNAAVSHTIARDLINQSDKIENRPEQLIAEQKTQEALDKLQRTFENFVKQRKPAIEVTDVVFLEEEKSVPTRESHQEDDPRGSEEGDSTFNEGLEIDNLEAEFDHGYRPV